MPPSPLPDFLGVVFDRFDGRPTAFHEGAVGGALRTVFSDDMAEEDRRVCITEWSAFSFATSGDNRSPEFMSYFRPYASFTKQGTTIHVPDPHQVDRQQVEHWVLRADDVRHPVLRARYSDLVWEFSRGVGIKPDVRRAREAVDAYVTASALPWDDLDEQYPFVQQWLRRARDLALGISDAALTSRVVAAMFAFFDRSAAIEKIGTWAFINDDLLDHPKIGIDEQRIQRIVDYMERALALMTNPGDPIALNLRNRVSHGLVDDDAFNRTNANRAMHALLATAAWTRDYLENTPAPARDA